jgi:hypothetical protein
MQRAYVRQPRQPTRYRVHGLRRFPKVSSIANRYEYWSRKRAKCFNSTERRFTNYRYNYLNPNRVELSMSLTDEDIAFLIKTGQITEAPKKETKTNTPTTEKSEE